MARSFTPTEARHELAHGEQNAPPVKVRGRFKVITLDPYYFSASAAEAGMLKLLARELVEKGCQVALLIGRPMNSRGRGVETRWFCLECTDETDKVFERIDAWCGRTRSSEPSHFRNFRAKQAMRRDVVAWWQSKTHQVNPSDQRPSFLQGVLAWARTNSAQQSLSTSSARRYFRLELRSVFLPCAALVWAIFIPSQTGLPVRIPLAGGDR